MPTIDLTLYGKVDCHLCDRLVSLLAPHVENAASRDVEFRITKRDIHDNPQWLNWYRYRIPVLTHAGKAILEGRPSEDEVAQVVAALVDQAV